MRVFHQVMPRRHQQELFPQLENLFDGRTPTEFGFDAIAYGRGPGSFTGLRIAVSAAQGLAYSLGIPVVGVSSLETQARTLLRREEIDYPCTIVSTIDARIGQVYAATYEFDGEGLNELSPAVVAPPEAVVLPASAAETAPVLGVGSGFEFQEQFASELRGITQIWPDLSPEAQDMLQPALSALENNRTEVAADARPDYVQRRIGWKTLAEQGRSA